MRWSILWLLPVLLLLACNNHHTEKTIPSENKKIGVLLVNHGSRSETWRNTLLELEHNVRDTIYAGGHIRGIKTAFMEYNEPSIATLLKEFDKEGYTDIILVPVFLTVSPHSFDDIPTIIGQKEDPHSAEVLKLERIERYTPKATVHITPLLDFTDMLQQNILRRYRALSEDPAAEGLVMIAYGDETYTREWSELLTRIGHYVGSQTGVSDFSFGWCGHIVRYNPDSTAEAIRQVLRKKERAIVVPVLVATDEMFQVKIIGDGIAKANGGSDKIIYKPDAILPDRNIEQWVVHTVAEYAGKINGRAKTSF